MSAAHFGMACRCGRSVSVPCPNLADILDIADGLTGWGFDKHGLAVCGECIVARSPRPVAEIGQGDLFGGTAC